MLHQLEATPLGSAVPVDPAANSLSVHDASLAVPDVVDDERQAHEGEDAIGGCAAGAGIYGPRRPSRTWNPTIDVNGSAAS